MRLFYLHGFASSPRSRKARFFIDKLARENITVQALDLAPDFENATVSSQLQILQNAIGGTPALLIGSSLGGYLAALFAQYHPHLIKRLVLLAPAFDFHKLWTQSLDPFQLEEWSKSGSLPFFHYGQNGYANLAFNFLKDAERYSPFPAVPQPCLIFHGFSDSVVPYQKSIDFAAQNPKARVVGLQSGHELTDVLDEIWSQTRVFLLNEDTGFS